MYFGGVVSSGSTGNCGPALQARGSWLSSLGYVDVPPEWYPLYYDYRVTMANLYSATQPLGEICEAGGGVLPEGTDRIIIDAIEVGQSTLNTVLIRAQELR